MIDRNSSREQLRPLDRMRNKQKKNPTHTNSTQKSNRACARTVAQTRFTCSSTTLHVQHAHENRPTEDLPPPLLPPTQKNKTKNEAVQTHSHTIAFPTTIQLTRLKKKHKNKLHKYFLPSLFFFFFLPPCFPCFHVWLFFSLSLCLSCGGFGVVPSPLRFCFFFGRTSSA